MRETIDWQVETLRVTAFPVDMSDVSAEKIWETCIDILPDETRIQRGGIETREAEYGNGRIFLIRQVDRIDWRYLSKQEDGDEPPQLPIIGGVLSELQVVKDLAKSWINSGAMIPISRLAFAAVLLNPVESVREGYDVLRTLLPTVNLENVKDLNYQVNRPRSSKVIDGISINRICRWNVTRLQYVMSVPTMEPKLSSVADELNACRLEFDINTAAEHTAAISSDALLLLLDELISTGLELSAKGDVV